MAEKNLSFKISADDDASKVFQKLSRTAKSEMGKVEDSLDDTRTAGKKAADALSSTFDQLDADLTATKSAADKLAQALGPELAGKIDTSKAVGEFQRLGLSIEEIEADADELAAALKKADDVNLKHFSAEADTAAGSVGNLRDNSDQSRSVMANMVGNTTQDLGALGGVAGTAGMALGQIGEYATEGGISLRNLAKVAGPMGALTVVALAVGAAMKSIADTKAFHKEQVKGFTDALEDSKLEAQELADVLAGTEAGGFMARVAGRTKDVIPELNRLGTTFEDVVEIVEGGNEAFDVWINDQIQAAGAAGATAPQILNLKAALEQARDEQSFGHEATVALTDGFRDQIYAALALAGVIEDVGTAENTSAERATFFGNSLADADGKAKGLWRTMAEGITTSGDLTEATEELTRENEAAAAAADAHREAVTRWRDEARAAVNDAFALEQAELDLADSMTTLEQQTIETNLILMDGARTDEEKAQASRDLRQAEIDAAGGALQAAEAFAASEGAAEGSKEETELMRQYLVGLQNQFPGLRDEIQRYIDKLNAIPTERTTTVRVINPTTSGGGTTGRMRAGATGLTARSGGETVLVGEKGPEIVTLPGRAVVHPNSNGHGTPVGGATVNVYVTAPLGDNPAALGQRVVRAVVDGLKLSGPAELRKALNLSPVA